MYLELGGEPGDEPYPSSAIPWQEGIDEGWIVVADELEYPNSIVSGLMDATRRNIVNDTDRSEDHIEKADTALVGLAAQLLETGDAEQIVLLTTDKPAGREAETLLPEYEGRKFRPDEFRYALGTLESEQLPTDHSLAVDRIVQLLFAANPVSPLQHLWERPQEPSSLAR